jgi:hypothetical protein
MFGFRKTRGTYCLTEELLVLKDFAAYSEFVRVFCYAARRCPLYKRVSYRDFLGAFADLRKATISVLSVCLSVWNNATTRLSVDGFP